MGAGPPMGAGPSLLPPAHRRGVSFGGPSFAKVRFSRRSHTGQVRRRAHSRRAPGKATPPYGRWGGVGVWGSPVQGEVRMVPYSLTATKMPFP
jgi:hypothetical protein